MALTDTAGGHRMLCAGVRADVLEDFTRLATFPSHVATA